jgi:septal ring factor EnvC (AmiA/AmiB activator)
LGVIEFAKIAQDFTPGAAGIWTLVVMFAAYLLREWRETRKLSFEDRLARREGYAKQVEDLTLENRKLREDVTRAWHEHEEYRRLCHTETDQLRSEIQSLSNEVAGFKRAIAAGEISAVRTLPPGTMSEATAAAAERTAGYLEERNGDETPKRI